MTILTWPSSLPGPSSISGPALKANTQSGGVSPFDGTEQTLELPGAHWVAELRFDRKRERDWRVLNAFLGQLRGRAGRFYWGPSGFQPRRGNDVAAGSGSVPRLSGSGVTGSTVGITGFAGNAGTYAFHTGDWFSFADITGRVVLHQVTADVAASSAVLSVPITPALRRPTVDGTAIELYAYTAIWRLQQDVVMPDFIPGNGPLASFTIPIEEAIW
jgi:hypothetical protein